MNFNENLIDILIAHFLGQERLKNGAVRRYLPIIKSVDDLLLNLFSNVYDGTKEQMAEFVKRVKAEKRKIYNKFEIELTKELKLLSIAESNYIANLLGAKLTAGLVNKPNKKVLERIARQEIRGMTVSDIIAKLESNDINNYIVNAKTSVVDGLTLVEARNRLKASNKTNRRHAGTIVHTMIAHITAEADNKVFKENRHIIKGVKLIVTFDNRTSPICIQHSVDDILYPVDRYPQPPFHMNAICKGELVMTDKGEKPIEDIKVGDMVVTHKGRLRKVLTTMKKRNDTNFIRVINFNTSRAIRVTDEHPVLIHGGWVRADAVKVGDSMFENIGDKAPIIERGSIVKVNPYDYPSLFRGEDVFFKVGTKSGSMTTSINLNSKFNTWYGKVFNRVANNPLMSPSIKTNGFKIFFKRFFAFNNSFSDSFKMTMKNAFFMDWISRRVIGFHSIRASFHNIAIGFIESMRPMCFANTNTIVNLDSSGNFSSFTPIKRLYSVNSTPPTHSTVRHRKFTLNSSKGFFKFMVVFFKKLYKKFFINEVGIDHWHSPVVSDISIVAYNGQVYNLEVEGDNTYLVNGIVVHNCRTRAMPITKSFAEMAKNTKARIPVGTRVSMTGTVPANFTYSDWLRRQSVKIQNDALGMERAQLFRDKKYTLDKFIDPTGKYYTLEDLYNRG